MSTKVYEIPIEFTIVTVEAVPDANEGRVRLAIDESSVLLKVDDFIKLVQALHGASGELMESQGVPRATEVSIQRGLLGGTYQA